MDMNMQSIVIKPYAEQYKGKIIQLILHIQTQEFGVTISIDDQPDLLNVHDCYQKNHGNFWVAMDGDSVIGTIAIINIGNGIAALRKMFVDEAYRGKDKGVAKLLLDETIRWCGENGFSDIYLGTTSVFLAAHRFYEKNGFIEVQKELLPTSFPLMKIDSKFYRYKI